jgi:hypothetical protein
MKYHLLFSALTLAVASTASSIASAADWKSYPGAFCQAPNTNTDIRRSSTGIANWSADRAFVHCPIVRDIQSGGTNQLRSVVISLQNNHSSQGGFCRLLSRTRNVAGVVDSVQKSWPAGYASHTISLGPVNATEGGNYLVSCQLPARQGAKKSLIHNIRTSEHE